VLQVVDEPASQSPTAVGVGGKMAINDRHLCTYRNRRIH